MAVFIVSFADMSRRVMRCTLASRMRSLCGFVLLYSFAIGAFSNESAPEVQRSLAKTGYEIATAHCGAKAKRAWQQVKNRFDEAVIDHRETIQCRGLVLVIYHATIHNPPLQILESLTLRGPHAKLPKPISPGSSREEVLAYAGKPMQVSPTFLVYLLNDIGPEQQTANFEFAHGKLISVTWWWGSG